MAAAPPFASPILLACLYIHRNARTLCHLTLVLTSEWPHTHGNQGVGGRVHECIASQSSYIPESWTREYLRVCRRLLTTRPIGGGDSEVTLARSLNSTTMAARRTVILRPDISLATHRTLVYGAKGLTACQNVRCVRRTGSWTRARLARYRAVCRYEVAGEREGQRFAL